VRLSTDSDGLARYSNSQFMKSEGHRCWIVGLMGAAVIISGVFTIYSAEGPSQKLGTAEHNNKGAETRTGPGTLTSAALRGKWQGSTNGMGCMLVITTNKATVYTFRGDKHVSTVFSPFTLDRERGVVTLGINGEARQISEDKLFLRFRAYNTNIITIKDVILEKTGV
jgi:hypothetical protein